MRTLEQLNLNGKKVLVRADLNVPLDKDLMVADNTRIRYTIPTVKKILAEGGSVILMSHLGRPKNGPEERFSLKNIMATCSELLGTEVIMANDTIGPDAREKAAALKPGQVLLLENLRFDEGEEQGDEAFAKALADLGDVYVNDAFGTLHRAHASTAMIAKHFKEKAFGSLVENELRSIEKILSTPQEPFTVIIGGAKVSSKIGVIENLLDKANKLIIGGGMVFTFIKAQGGKVGNSLVEEDKIDLARDILSRAKEKGVELLLPEDALIADAFSNEANMDQCPSNEIPDGWMGLDIGKRSIETMKPHILDSRTILWNGPMGVFEMERFMYGTLKIGEAVAEATEKGAFSLVGGGDSVSAVHKAGLEKAISFISTGGGALLEYLEGKDLPGVVAMRG